MTEIPLLLPILFLVIGLILLVFGYTWADVSRQNSFAYQEKIVFICKVIGGMMVGFSIWRIIVDVVELAKVYF